MKTYTEEQVIEFTMNIISQYEFGNKNIHNRELLKESLDCGFGDLTIKPDSKLIDSMAMRYRHDFGLLGEDEQNAIRTTMKQIWEEVVGLGFYKENQNK